MLLKSTSSVYFLVSLQGMVISLVLTEKSNSSILEKENLERELTASTVTEVLKLKEKMRGKERKAEKEEVQPVKNQAWLRRLIRKEVKTNWRFLLTRNILCC